MKRNAVLCILALFLLAGCRPEAEEGPQPAAAARPEGGSPATPAADTIRLTNGEWPPHTGERLFNYGCDSWVVSEAFALEGIQVEFGFFPWARGYRLAADGVWDGAVEWADTPQHREAFYLSETFLSEQKWVFFYRSSSPLVVDSIEDLSDTVVGLTSGYAYSGLFDKALQEGKIQFEEAASDEANFQKLLAGRIDAFLVEKQVGIQLVSTLFTLEEQSQIAYQPTVFNEFKAYLMLSKQDAANQERVRKFDNGLQRLKDSGRYEQIMRLCVLNP